MLFPQENGSRVLIGLDGLWQFAIDPNNDGETKGWANGIPACREIAVPASWNEQYQDLMDFCETGWYQKEIEIPNIYRGQLLKLRIGAANYLTKVWVNGNLVGEHEGGHLPMEFDLTDQFRFNTVNRIVIAVDARIMPDRLPPGGVEAEQVVGFKGQYPNNYYDFYPYGGINRSVYLCVLSQTHLTSIATEPTLDKDTGMICYQLCINRPTTVKVQVSLNSQLMDEVRLEDQQSVRGAIIVPNPRLWSPDDPYLYQVKFELYDEDRVIDQYKLSVGLRTIKIEGTKLLLNGKPIFLRGFGMHEDFPVIGKGLNQTVIVKDMNLLHWIGANSIRTSHYPYSEEFLSYADQIGILVIGETPFVGFVRSHYRSEAIMTKVQRVITEMITRDYNHPCIIAWSIANEGDTFVPEADGFYKNLYNYVKLLDHSRPLTITNCRTITGDYALKHFDIISLNRYRGWYELPGRLDQGCEVLSTDLDECFEVYRKPIFVTEFGAEAMAGVHFDPPHQFSEEYQAEIVTRQCRIIEAKPYTIGAHIWAFADFKTSQNPTRTVLNRKGLFTRERQPKLAAHQVRKLWSKPGASDLDNNSGLAENPSYFNQR